MRPRRFAAALLACLLMAGGFAYAGQAEPELSARSSILIEANTGRVLYESEADEPRLIASTTKIMTALVVIENCDLDETVEILPEYTAVEGSSIYLAAGEKLTVKELLYGMLLKSGNDAATSLACHAAGSVDVFADMMNRKAGELGLKNCHFENPHGLDDENHKCSARDLAAITAAAMKHEVFCEIVATKSITIGQRYMKNSNKMLQYYDAAIGVKTGFTKSAGRTLVSAAEKDGMRLIAVTLNDPNDWADHTELFDYGFSAYSTKTLCAKGEYVTALPVIGGESDKADIVVSGDCAATLAEGEELTSEVFLPAFVYAEVKKGARAGFIAYYVGGEKAAEAELVFAESVAMQEVKPKNLWERFWGLLG